ncbi:MAG TPA: lamin tail domain-containing protein [Marinagarivorans sp.]
MSTSNAISSESSEDQAATAQLTISEIVAKSDDDAYLAGNDWIELYNAGSSIANLGDYALADSGSDIIPLPAISIAPGKFLETCIKVNWGSV